MRPGALTTARNVRVMGIWPTDRRLPDRHERAPARPNGRRWMCAARAGLILVSGVRMHRRTSARLRLRAAPVNACEQCGRGV